MEQAADSEQCALATADYLRDRRAQARSLCLTRAPLAVKKAISIIDGSYDGPGKELLGPDHVLRAIKIILDRALPVEPVKVTVDQSQRTQVLSLAGVPIAELMEMLKSTTSVVPTGRCGMGGSGGEGPPPAQQATDASFTVEKEAPPPPPNSEEGGEG